MEIWDVVAQILKGTDKIGRLFLSLHLLAQGCTVVASILTPIDDLQIDLSFFPFKEIIIFNKFG